MKDQYLEDIIDKKNKKKLNKIHFEENLISSKPHQRIEDQNQASSNDYAKTVHTLGLKLHNICLDQSCLIFT